MGVPVADAIGRSLAAAQLSVFSVQRTGNRLSVRVSACCLLFFCYLFPDCVWSSDDDIVRNIDIVGLTRTKSDVVRRELLFKPGDRLSASVIDETARNLRALLFLGEIDVRTTQVGADSADVIVSVRDLYSRALTPLLSGEPDELSYGVVGLDYNLLGSGQVLQVTGRHDAVTGNETEVFYRAPRWFGSRSALTGIVGFGGEGYDASLWMSRPFYRLSERWSYSVALSGSRALTRLYSGQTVVEQYEGNRFDATARVTGSWGGQIKVRPGLQMSFSRRAFDPDAGFCYAPEDRHRATALATMTIWKPAFERARYYRLLGRVEDVQTGSWAQAWVGGSSPVFGSDRSYGVVGVRIVPRLIAGSGRYLFASLGFSGRMSGGTLWQRLVSADLTGHWKICETHAIAARARWDVVSRTEDRTQLLLGPEQGLRGYVLRRFEGTRRYVVNVEGRVTLVRRPTFTAAAVAFVDGGRAWTSGSPGRPVWAVGLGGRVGLSRVYGAPVMRADLGYGFEDRAWVLFVGLGQYF